MSMSYSAPLQDIRFVLHALADLEQISQLPGCEDANADTVHAVLEENAKFVSQVIAPLNWESDKHPSAWHNGTVTTTPGFKQAFKAFVEAGWQGLQHPVEYGGQGLPKLVGTPCIEMLNAGSLSFALCPLLTDGAIEALLLVGTEAQKNLYLPRLIDGTWTGTMNLTEPQAGSDLGLVRSKAVPQNNGGGDGSGDGSVDSTYRISGQKIFITYGEHDMAENIIHLVLARTPTAPEGVKGISLFIVPKFLVNPDGSLGARNDVQCVSLEHKLGIKASPTATLQFGEAGGATGYLVGEENRGLEYMFIMMNAARFAVGMQGIGVAERAYQKAVSYARERVQSRPVDGSAKASVAIIQHPDVQRMLLSMRAHTEAARALAYVTAAAFDIAHHHPDLAVCAQQQAVYEFMVPLVKGWSTEMSLEVTSLGVQVHGGMGYIEETGAAQYFRDARILTIYEGTTAIQANDLVGRKTVRDNGALALTLAAQIATTEAALAKVTAQDAATQAMHHHLSAARKAFETVVPWIVSNAKVQPNAVYAGSVPYLKLAAMTLAGWQMARALLAAQHYLTQENSTFDRKYLYAKLGTCHFYAEHILNQVPGLAQAVMSGSASITTFAQESY